MSTVSIEILRNPLTLFRQFEVIEDPRLIDINSTLC